MEKINAELYFACAETDDWAPPEMVEGLTATFGRWYVKTIEDVGVGREKK